MKLKKLLEKAVRIYYFSPLSKPIKMEALVWSRLTPYSAFKNLSSIRAADKKMIKLTKK